MSDVLIRNDVVERQGSAASEPLPHMLHDGKVITAVDLPKNADIRWNPERKILVVLAVDKNLISKEEAQDRYHLNPFELALWRELNEAGGRKAVRSTKLHCQVAHAFSEIELALWDAMIQEKLRAEPPRERLGLSGRAATYSGASVHLTKQEAQYLALLIRFRTTVVSREMLWQLVHKDNNGIASDSKIIDVILCKARKKLAAAFRTHPSEIIQTYWGRGYCLIL